MNSKKSPRRGPATDNVAKLTIKEDGTLLAAAAALLPDHKPTKLKSLLTPQPVGNKRCAINTV